MPKKSRRQKILADARRKQTTPSPHIHESPRPMAEPAALYQLNLNKTSPTAAPDTQTDELVLIKRDVTKTILLAVLAIAIEFALYWYGKHLF